MSIHDLADRTLFPVKNIFLMNGSIRSDHSNAYFYGFGPQKVIVIYDTLILKLTSE
jgi:STE24 endopeptidase